MAATNLQQDVLEKIRTGLETARAALNVPLLFGHLCKGNLEKPGVLRVSAVVGDAANLAGVPNPCDHDIAFLRHVQRFGREKTLLNWLVCWTRSALATQDRTNTNVSATASFLVHTNGGALVTVEKEALSVRATLSKDLLRSLVPDGLAKIYLTTLYGDIAEPAEFCGRSIPELELLTAKLQTLRMLKKCADGTKNFGELCQAYLAGANGGATTGAPPSDPQMLQLLCALQIAFAYAEVFTPDCLDAGGFVSVSRPHQDTFNDSSKHLEIVPVFAASTSVKNAGEVDGRQNALTEAAKREPLSAALQKVSAVQEVASAKEEMICSITRFSSASAQQLAEILEKHVPNPPFHDWSRNAAMWIAHLVSYLRGAKHEGGALEFTFVLGDMAQIEDSDAFEQLSLENAGFEFPMAQSPTNEKALRAALDQVKRAIEKENYFWFQGGRYALLWDFTFPVKQPRHLLGLKDSSWHVFIANARNRMKPVTADAALVVGYLDDRGGGGLIVGGEHAFSLSQKGEWIQRGDELSSRIGDYLKAAGTNILTEKERETLVKAMVAVSNDPDTGCMLVLANSVVIPDFETMGQPWKIARAASPENGAEPGDPLVELPDQELIALLGMDGAACVWKQDGKCRIAFRRLARPDDASKSHQPAGEARKRLSGEGSRKWSALLAACRKDVNLIIAVSQDGPVHFYGQAKIAKAVDSSLKNGAFKAKFGTDNDEEVVHEKYDGKEESK